MSVAQRKCTIGAKACAALFALALSFRAICFASVQDQLPVIPDFPATSFSDILMGDWWSSTCTEDQLESAEIPLRPAQEGEPCAALEETEIPEIAPGEQTLKDRYPVVSEPPAPSFSEILMGGWLTSACPESPRESAEIPLQPAQEGEPCAALEGQEVSEAAAGGQTFLPKAEKPLPPAILPEMTPLQRPGSEEDFLDIIHGGINYGFLATATWLDSFFGDAQYIIEENQSRFRSRYLVFLEKGKPMQRGPEVKLHLVLPQMKKKFHVVISGDPNEDVETSLSPAVPQSAPLIRPEDRNVTTSLHYFFRATERRSYSIKTGAKLHHGKPVLFVGPRARYFIPLDAWGFRLTQEIPWSTNIGWISTTIFDLERSLPENLFFRISLRGVRTEHVDGYPYGLSFALIQPIDRRSALAYEWINSFKTRPTNGLEEELFVVRYRRRVWRDWLYMEIAPQERFPRNLRFRGTHGILFKLEMIIGDFRDFIF